MGSLRKGGRSGSTSMLLASLGQRSITRQRCSALYFYHVLYLLYLMHTNPNGSLLPQLLPPLLFGKWPKVFTLPLISTAKKSTSLVHVSSPEPCKLSITISIPRPLISSVLKNALTSRTWFRYAAKNNFSLPVTDNCHILHNGLPKVLPSHAFSYSPPRYSRLSLSLG
jgi:hypothetical protein